MNKHKNIAFTLAEVLIIIGIIGVVSVITIPNLVNNYQERQFKAKWKKIYSQFTQISKKIAEDYSNDDFSSIVEDVRKENNLPEIHGRNDALNIIFRNYFKHLQFACNGHCSGSGSWGCLSMLGRAENNRAGYSFLNGNNAGYWVLGYTPTACFQVVDFNFALDTYANDGVVSVDVNGSRKPNVIGKDIFVLKIKDLNNVIPGGGKKFYDGELYACDKNASKGGPACSVKYLKEN
ncbi:hypothetical protein IJ541_06205 [bacterium]|nr:hypothetical protein [bacterium]